MLSPLLLIPFLGAITLMLWPTKISPMGLRSITAALLSIQLLWNCGILFWFDSSSGIMQMSESIPWISSIGLNYDLAVDGLSLPLLFINGGLSLIATWVSTAVTNRPRLYFALLLIITGAVNGAFLAQNLLLFFIFYELELIPLWLLIAIWGGKNRAYAATKFLIFTAISGILILAAFLGLALATNSVDFSLRPLLSQELNISTQLVLMGALLIGFGIKIPLFPFHNWLPDAHTEASTPVSILLAGVLLKLGTYGLLRFCVGLFPEAWYLLAPWLAAWAALSILFGSLAAIAQTDMKRMVAYSSVGHMGYVLLAAAAATPVSLLGAEFQMISHGLISGLLFLVVGVVYSTTGTRNLEILRGLLNPQRGLPLTGSLMILGVMASAGIPGMAGFLGEFLIFRGSLQTFPIATILSMVGSGLTAVYFLLLVNRAFFGRLTIAPSGNPTVLKQVYLVDQIPALSLCFSVLILGLVPSLLSNLTETSTNLLSAIAGFVQIGALT
ncbi:NADH dehydrogenase I chain 4 (chromatophore) [Paulinella micropora]|uniref:NADH dehydrogenase I chain 4 n=1 Tax=Paulinella micropora TaxID=1928728 RepID=A0A1L5YD70_9EUKA|nr:NADH dehydrogenase I chain 4 (or M) [Paulinella micropora]AQX45429.1 NADH dehydrogenase I chain 4 [Paulinella micropora]BBL86649.1 NADH dehydrogenase I chain 4 [Paulinella micropora]